MFCLPPDKSATDLYFDPQAVHQYMYLYRSRQRGAIGSTLYLCFKNKLCGAVQVNAEKYLGVTTGFSRLAATTE
jgi:hypothetical protein